MVISPNGECCEVDSAKAEPPPFKLRKSDAACASSLWRVISPVGECCEAVITRRSWKFASIAVAKMSKSLGNTDFSGTPKATENRISKNISKKLNIRWYLRKQFHIRRVIEAVITRRSWKLPSCVYVISWKPLILLGFSHHRMHFARSVSRSFLAIFFTEGYRSGHNEAVLKTVCPLDTWVRISHPPP